ncbi:hypothetical protein HZA42_03080 [Candidatus Peregrinibacteria bacterium]|nr:hypothetical protein [Candidatus Peregrinibacteria bacterium]
MEFKNILKVILVEGPLHPYITVRPPPLLPPLMLCGVHYESRPKLAGTAVHELVKLGMGERVTAVQGGCEDDVVPIAAQVLPHNHAGRVVTLPEHAVGLATGLKKALPQGYRNHLFWSEAKMNLVTDVVLWEAADI